jgi:hypothetical protein
MTSEQIHTCLAILSKHEARAAAGLPITGFLSADDVAGHRRDSASWHTDEVGRLDAYLRAARMPYYKFARLAGLSPSGVRLWLRGLGRPGRKSLAIAMRLLEQLQNGGRK